MIPCDTAKDSAEDFSFFNQNINLHVSISLWLNQPYIYLCFESYVATRES